MTKNTILILLTACLLFSTERIVTPSVEISEEFINQEVAVGLTEAVFNFPNIVDDISVVGIIRVPDIELNQNQMVVNIPLYLRIFGDDIIILGFPVDIDETIEGTLHPTLNIPPLEVSALEVIAYFEEEFPQILESFVRDSIEDLLDLLSPNYDLCGLINCETELYQPAIDEVLEYYDEKILDGIVIYPKQLIQDLGDLIPDNLNMTVDDIEPGYIVNDGNITFNFPITIDASYPTFLTELIHTSGDEWYLRVYSSIETEIEIKYVYPPPYSWYLDPEPGYVGPSVIPTEIPSTFNVQLSTLSPSGGTIYKGQTVIFPVLDTGYEENCEKIKLYIEGPFGYYREIYEFEEPTELDTWTQLTLD